MNRVEFMSQLERLLSEIPEHDRQDAIAYYNDYFDEAGAENEARVIRELGSPGRVAAMIKADLKNSENENKERENSERPVEYKGNEKQKRNLPWPLIIVLIIFAAPLLLGVGGGLLGGVMGVLGGLLGVILASLISCLVFIGVGIVCFVLGVIRLFLSPLEGVVLLAAGSFLLAVGLALLVLFIWCAFKWLPALFRVVVDWCRKLFQKGERRSDV